MNKAVFGKSFICLFTLLCSYILIHSLQTQLLSLCLFVLMFRFIHSFIAGKTMENLRNRCAVDLVTSEEKLKKLAVQPSFKQFKIFHENLVAMERARVDLTLNQPIYVGFAILDLSKTLMYDFHYNYIKRKYPDSTLLFTDTDSLTYQIQTDNRLLC